MTKRTIETVDDLVDEFGGTGKFAEFLSIVPSAVSNMLAKNRVPPGYHLELYLECRKRGLDAGALFGLGAAAKPRKTRMQGEKRAS